MVMPNIHLSNSSTSRQPDASKRVLSNPLLYRAMNFYLGTKNEGTREGNGPSRSQAHKTTQKQQIDELSRECRIL